MNASSWIAMALAALCVCTALSIAYSAHISRQLHAELGFHQKHLDALDVQWSQLQIEVSTFSEHGLVERTARDRLDMVFPNPKDTVMIAQ